MPEFFATPARARRFLAAALLLLASSFTAPAWAETEPEVAPVAARAIALASFRDDEAQMPGTIEVDFDALWSPVEPAVASDLSVALQEWAKKDDAESVVVAETPSERLMKLASFPAFASLAPMASSALDAIESLAPASAPRPAEMPQALAYARAGTAAAALEDEAAPALEVSAKEAECLSVAIYHEARGESEEGQMAVAQVVLNRVADSKWADTICGVVFENEGRRNACQFSFACDGRSDAMRDRRAAKVARRIAADAIAGKNLLPGLTHANHYHATYVNPNWAPKMVRLAGIGTHVFYED